MVQRQWSWAFAVLGAWSTLGWSAEPAFKKVMPTDAVRFVSALSEDRQVCTMIFDNLAIDTRIGKVSLPSVETRQFTFVTTVEATKPSEVEITLRGFVSRQGSGSATLLVHSQGASYLVKLDEAMKAQDSKKPANPSVTQQRATELATAEGFEATPTSNANDYVACFKRLVPANGKVQTTVFLLVDRLDDSEDAGALLTVDSIDFEVKPAP